MEKVAELKDLKEKLCVSINGKALALFKVKDKIYCTDNKCTHLGGPLCKGKIIGNVIQCPWHKSEFDIKTGKIKQDPAKKDVKTYRVSVKGDDIFVDI